MRRHGSQMGYYLPAVLLIAGLTGCSAPPTTLEDLKEVNGRLYLRKNGKPYSGKVVAFHDRDQMRWERSLLGGLPHGLEVGWDAKGRVLHEMSWERGELREWLGSDSLFEEWFSHNRSGQLIDNRTEQPFSGKITWLLNSGTKSGMVFYKMGVQEGPFVQWHTNGQESCRGTVREGIRFPTHAWDLEGNPTLQNGSGWIVLFFPSGSEREVVPYEAGILEGSHQRWHSSGRKKSEIVYRQGFKHGLEKEWHENGNIRWERTWQDGLPCGTDTWWSPDGEVLSQTLHESGLAEVKD